YPRAWATLGTTAANSRNARAWEIRRMIIFLSPEVRPPRESVRESSLRRWTVFLAPLMEASIIVAVYPPRLLVELVTFRGIRLAKAVPRCLLMMKPHPRVEVSCIGA